jgi:hypothetical protein
MTETRKTWRMLAAAAAVPTMVVGLTAPADAASKWHYKSTDTTAYADWVEWGELPGVGGNAHTGYLEVSQSGSGAQVWGVVTDYQCDEGEIPGGGGHGGHALEASDYEEYPEEGYCDPVSERYIDGGDVTLTMDRKLTSARLTGTLRVDDHGSSASPAVDMSWTGEASLVESRWTDSYRDGSSTYYVRYDSTSRQGVVTGFIGAMGFADDADDESSGTMSRTKAFERSSTR